MRSKPWLAFEVFFRLDRVTRGEKMGFVVEKVTFFACSGSGAWVVGSGAGSGGWVREGGGVGTLPRSSLSGVDTVGVLEGGGCFGSGSGLLERGVSICWADDPGVGKRFL